MGTFLALALVVMVSLGAPLFVVIAAAALGFFYLAGVDLSVVIIEIYRLATSPMLIALFLFALAGYVLAESRASTRLVKLSTAVLGRAPGGLAIVAMVSCAFFTALSFRCLWPLGLLYRPHRRPLSRAILPWTAHNVWQPGSTVSPSLPLIVYGLVAEVDISRLFIAGILPGTLMIILLSAYSMYKAVRSGTAGRAERVTLQDLAGTFRESIWEILLPAVILRGIFGGFLAVSEAYAILVEVVIKREVGFTALASVALKTATMVGAITVILGASLAFNSCLIDQQIPNQILTFMQTHVQSKLSFFLLLNIFLLGVGCVLDIFSALVIVVPLIVPIARSYGIDLFHLGIVFLTNLQVGYSTPSIGMNLFIASLRFKKPVVQLYMASLPFSWQFCSSPSSSSCFPVPEPRVAQVRLSGRGNFSGRRPERPMLLT